MKNKLVVFGLTADPFHKGHLEIIKNLSKRFDKVVVVPTTIRYYKKNVQMFSFNERYNSILEAISNNNLQNAVVSDLERNVPDTWRFVDSLMEIKKTFGQEDYEYYVAMGSDSFQKFETWCNYQTILDNVESLVVFKRPGYEDSFPQNIKYIYIEDINLDISSTMLRERIKEYVNDINDFDTMIDDITFIDGFENELDNIEYKY